MIFLDLENLAFLAPHLAPMAMLCRSKGIEFRSYTTDNHDHACRATHTVKSSQREAVDVRIVWDVAKQKKETAMLVVTNDQFGKTLSDVAYEANVAHVEYSSILPQYWQRILGVVTFENFFQQHGIERERRARSNSRASWSRPASEMGDSVWSVWSTVSRKRGRTDKRERKRCTTPVSTIQPKTVYAQPKTVYAPVQPKTGYALARSVTTNTAPSAFAKKQWPTGVHPTRGKVRGTIVFFDPRLAYGFITNPKGKDIYMPERVIYSYTRASDSLRGFEVEYKIQHDRKGKLIAVDVSGPNGTQLP